MTAARVAVVTGAARGIGRCVAERFLRDGYAVVLADVDEGALRQAAAELGGSDASRVLAVPVDLRIPAAIDGLFSRVESVFGRTDVLVNNAGIGRTRSPYDLTVDEWDEVIATDLRATFLASRAAARLMRRNHGGAIVNIASTRAIMSEPNTEAYAASKGGIVALTHALAASLGPDGIRVNAVSPGWIATQGYDELTSADHAQHLSGRVGTPEDIALACLYLSSPDNGFVTGANLVVDGGMTKKMIYEE